MEKHKKIIAAFTGILIIAPLLYGKGLPPSNIKIAYTETTLDITWDTVPGATGYNIYTGRLAHIPKKDKIKVNQKLITSGSHFAYIWHFENGEKVRKIKGHKHYISVTSVFSIKGKNHESALSEEINNCYFDGFKRIDSRKAILNILQKSQRTSFLPVKKIKNRKEDFIKFMEGPGKKLNGLIEKHIDPKETGGCEPVSTILVKILKNSGLHAYRIEGNFIKEFHTFVIININNVEYILDFTANQFIPDVTPVMIPRDFCHLNENGKLSETGNPVYSIAKIYNADQTELTKDKSADIYRKIYTEVINYDQ